MNILFVCTGNTCRSAMAEGLAKKIINNRDLNISVASAGIFAFSGESASYNSIAVMKEYDVDILMHKSTSIQEINLKEIDYIFCATENHKNYILENYHDIKAKVYTIKEFAEFDNYKDDPNIKDPWGYDINSYRACAAEISLCVEKIIDILETKG